MYPRDRFSGALLLGEGLERRGCVPLRLSSPFVGVLGGGCSRASKRAISGLSASPIGSVASGASVTIRTDFLGLTSVAAANGVPFALFPRNYH